MFKRPEKLLLACDRVLDWRLARAKPADPTERGYPRRVLGGVTHWSFDSFLSKKQFETFCWPTWKKALLATIELGFIPYVYCEGVCDSRVEYFLEMPKGKVLLHFEQSDLPRAKAILKDHVCIGGEVPASLLQIGSPHEVEDYCRDLIKACGEGGGFILTAETGLTRRAKPENVRAIVESAKKYGRY
jgi:uroporphyrinogen-III decarboxylase